VSPQTFLLSDIKALAIKHFHSWEKIQARRAHMDNFVEE
jgi:hypothetical protein